MVPRLHTQWFLTKHHQMSTFQFHSSCTLTCPPQKTPVFPAMSSEQMKSVLLSEHWKFSSAIFICGNFPSYSPGLVSQWSQQFFLKSSLSLWKISAFFPRTPLFLNRNNCLLPNTNSKSSSLKLKRFFFDC